MARTWTPYSAMTMSRRSRAHLQLFTETWWQKIRTDRVQHQLSTGITKVGLWKHRVQYGVSAAISTRSNSHSTKWLAAIAVNLKRHKFTDNSPLQPCKTIWISPRIQTWQSFLCARTRSSRCQFRHFQTENFSRNTTGRSPKRMIGKRSCTISTSQWTTRERRSMSLRAVFRGTEFSKTVKKSLKMALKSQNPLSSPPSTSSKRWVSKVSQAVF